MNLGQKKGPFERLLNAQSDKKRGRCIYHYNRKREKQREEKLQLNFHGSLKESSMAVRLSDKAARKKSQRLAFYKIILAFL